MPFPAPELLVVKSAFQDRTDRFPLDDLMREAGFTIYLRPRGEALWKNKYGEIILERFAIAMAKIAAVKRRQQQRGDS